MLYVAFLAAVSGTAGLLGGLTGIGGVIMPPLMMAFFHVPPHIATSMAQATYTIPSLLAVAMFVRKGQFDRRIALPLAIAGFCFSWLSAVTLKPLLNSGGLSLLFAGCVVVSGFVTLWKPSLTLETPLAPPKRGLVLAGAGALVGTLAGITGSGSNSILVPVMSFLGFDLLKVLAACQMFTVLSSFAGTLGNMRYMDLNFFHIGVMIAAQIVGVNIGVRTAQRTNTVRLRKIVGAVCLSAGLFMAARAAQEAFA